MGPRFWLLWTVATALASLIVFALPYWLGAISFGLIVGVAQWLLLRGRIERAARWIPANIVAWPAGLAASYGAHIIAGKVFGISHLPIAGYSAATGFAVGAIQWLVLRRSLPAAGWWIGASVVAWAAAFGVGYEVRNAISFPLAGALSGAIGGVITGAVFVWLYAGRAARRLR